MAKKRKTVVKKIPALRNNVSSNALKTKTKIASMQEKIQVLNKDINATEDEKINEMIKVSEEIAEYHHWHEAQEPSVSVKSLTWHKRYLTHSVTRIQYKYLIVPNFSSSWVKILYCIRINQVRTTK